MEVYVMTPAFNFEPKYRVTMLTRENMTKGTGTPPVVKGLIWFTYSSKMNEGTGTGVYGQSVGGRLSFSLGMLQFFRLRYMLSWHMLMKFNFRVDQRSIWVTALIVRQLWKLFRPSEPLHWSKSAKRYWMISLPGMLWGCIGLLDMLGYKEIKSLTSSQGATLI